MTLISIFIPCYNEEGNLHQLFKRLYAVTDTLGQYDFEFVLADNKSTDNSRAILREYAQKDKRVKLVFNTRNFGPGRSGAYGLFQTSGDASVCLAADLQDPPELIPQFIEKWEEGNHVVLGRIKSRSERSSLSFFRKLYYKMLGVFSQHDEYEDITGFGLYDKEVVELFSTDGNPSPNFRILLTEYGFETAFIDYDKAGRTVGSSSYSVSSYIDTVVDSVIELSRKPLYFIIKVGAAAAVLFFLVMLACFIAAIVTGSSTLWIITVLFLMCMGIALAVMAVGVSGMYAAASVEWTRQRPLVIEEERINFDEPAPRR